MNNMAKRNKRPPSRKRYEEEHPTLSFRLDKETHQRLKQYLQDAGCSLADFVKDAVNKEESMVKKRVEMLASRQAPPSVEERLRCLEDLVQQLSSALNIIGMTLGIDAFVLYCPRCENQELVQCEGREGESTLPHSWVFTWRCQKCGFFLDTYKRIAPDSIKLRRDNQADNHSGKPKI